LKKGPILRSPENSERFRITDAEIVADGASNTAIQKDQRIGPARQPMFAQPIERQFLQNQQRLRVQRATFPRGYMQYPCRAAPRRKRKTDAQ